MSRRLLLAFTASAACGCPSAPDDVPEPAPTGQTTTAPHEASGERAQLPPIGEPPPEVAEPAAPDGPCAGHVDETDDGTPEIAIELRYDDGGRLGQIAHTPAGAPAAMRTTVEYGPDGRVARVEEDWDADGRADVVDRFFYEEAPATCVFRPSPPFRGCPTHMETDENGDGNPDRIESFAYQEGVLSMWTEDRAPLGSADRRTVYAAEGGRIVSEQVNELPALEGSGAEARPEGSGALPPVVVSTGTFAYDEAGRLVEETSVTAAGVRRRIRWTYECQEDTP